MSDESDDIKRILAIKDTTKDKLAYTVRTNVALPNLAFQRRVGRACWESTHSSICNLSCSLISSLGWQYPAFCYVQL